MTVAVRKHPFQGTSCKDDVAGQFLHQDSKVVEVRVGICEEFVHNTQAKVSTVLFRKDFLHIFLQEIILFFIVLI